MKPSVDSHPWGPPVPEVEDGAMLWADGFWADAIGLGLMAGSGRAFSLSFGAGISLYASRIALGLGGGSAALGIASAAAPDQAL